MPENSINLTVQGNKVAEVLDKIINDLRPQIKNLIKNELQRGLMKQLAPIINKVVADQNGVTELYPGIDLDWQINAAPTINPSEFSFGIKGLMFPKNSGEVEPKSQPPAMPLHDSKIASKFQFFLSNYVADSGVSSYLKNNLLGLWIKSTDVPSASPIQLNTSSLNKFFPGLEAHYGANKPMNMLAKVAKLDNF